MTIIKNKLTQMILVGMITSLISGVFGFFVFSTVEQNSTQKKIIIIDVAKQNPLTAGITRLSVLKNLNDKIYQTNELVNEEYRQSIQWTILKYQRNKKLDGGCNKIQFGLTDNSIFMETINYPLKDEPKMISCINNLLDLSFQRLKRKIESNTNEEILRVKFISEDLYLKKKLIENKLKKNLVEKKQKSKSSYVKESIRTKLCEELDTFSVNAFVDNNLTSDLPSYIEIIQNLYFLSSFYKDCEDVTTRIKPQMIDQEIENMMKTEQNLEKAKKILSKAKFNDVFKIEILSHDIEGDNNFISPINIVLSFSLFGFIFGILLFYNLRKFK
ncbi:hypothetical protein N9365_05440 [Candidatus Pelagibacter sp.]|nr:hypothetical protein [Candidatus Pelagibacter sp.]